MKFEMCIIISIDSSEGILIFGISLFDYKDMKLEENMMSALHFSQEIVLFCQESKGDSLSKKESLDNICHNVLGDQ